MQKCELPRQPHLRVGTAFSNASRLKLDSKRVNLARVDLVSIRLALVCAELGSLSAAARALHCSVSTASYRLSALEEAFGTCLFIRDFEGLRVMPAGEVFLLHAAIVLEQVEVMETKIRALVSQA
ncbi:LysR family transcriptional regulator [Variovorax sp. J22R133]|uniref:helix-turn-helix domain-containing protein n=1 Tax=Variovorax brevis TaxID=3053503 RepID=UPI002577AEA7|nr:LysR family transcriptional regulator [Variovorax sp. J22R133]MDM0116257.1 LysR family transcriptional regulator [Variovorax sp. J22R133]